MSGVRSATQSQAVSDAKAAGSRASGATGAERSAFGDLMGAIDASTPPQAATPDAAASTTSSTAGGRNAAQAEAEAEAEAEADQPSIGAAESLDALLAQMSPRTSTKGSSPSSDASRRSSDARDGKAGAAAASLSRVVAAARALLSQTPLAQSVKIGNQTSRKDSSDGDAESRPTDEAAATGSTTRHRDATDAAAEALAQLVQAAMTGAATAGSSGTGGGKGDDGKSKGGDAPTSAVSSIEDHATEPAEAAAASTVFQVEAVRTFLAVGSPAERFASAMEAEALGAKAPSAVTLGASPGGKVVGRRDGPRHEATGHGGSGATRAVDDTGAVSASSEGASAATGLGARDGGKGDAKFGDASKQDAAVAIAGSDTTSGLSATPAGLSGLAFAVADLPQAIAVFAAGATATGESAPTSSTASTASAGPSAARADSVVKELELSLDPAELGKIRVKLRSDGGALSVTIEVERRSALGQIEAQKDQIAQRLTSDGQSVSSVTVREASTGAPATNDRSADMSGQSEQNANQNPGQSGNRDAGGGFGDGNYGSSRNSSRQSFDEPRQAPRDPSDAGDGLSRWTRSGVVV